MGLDGFRGEFYLTLLGRTYPHIIPKKIHTEEHVSLILQDQHHSDTKSRQKYHNKKYRPLSLMNIDAKILNKILTNQIQQY